MNHIERVFYANRLMMDGKSDKEIIDRFRKFEDFDRKTTEQHIKAIRRGRRGY